jgi:hypothetical protein
MSTVEELQAEVGRLQALVAKAGQRLFEPSFADKMSEYMATVEGLPPGAYDMLYGARERIKDLERVAVLSKDKVARYEAKISQWMPIVASSQESDKLPENWHWREPWKFSAIGPGGAVCEPKRDWPWCSDAPKPVMQVVGHRACTVQATITANQIAKPLAERAHVRDTREGEWPEDGQEILRWTNDCQWHACDFGGPDDVGWQEDPLWLPAPPPPEES